MQNPFDLLNKLKSPYSILNSNFSTKSEKEDTYHLDQILKDDIAYDENYVEHKEIIIKLKYLIRIWIKDLLISKSDLLKNTNNIFKGELLVFGSLKLDSFTRDSDIDTVCVVPNFINREEDFFQKFYAHLKAEQNITDLVAIPDSNVPLIKLTFCKIKIDILFARLSKNVLSENLEEILLSPEKVLQNFDDEKSLLSINGVITCDLILKCVPNKENFKKTLKYVKLWARNKALYSSLMGYLGGVSWSILVAKICQLFPNYEPSKLFEKFFFIYNRWDFDEVPITINSVGNIENKNNTYKFIKDKYIDKEKSCITILTPGFPFQNCAYNVSSNSLTFIKEQIRDAVDLIIKIKQGKNDWKSIFDKYNPFSIFSTFLEFRLREETKKVNRENDDKCNFPKWKGHFENKIRRFLKILETNIINNFVEYMLYPLPIKRTKLNNNYMNNNQSISYFFCFKIRERLAEKELNDKYINLSYLIKYFLEMVDMEELVPDEIVIEIKLLNKNDMDIKNLSPFENFNANTNYKKLCRKKDFLKKDHNNELSDDYHYEYFSKMLNDYSFYDERPNVIFSFYKNVKHVF